MITTIFWISLAVLIYTYVGYGVVLRLFIGIKRLFSNKPQQPNKPATSYPEVTHLIAAYNEADTITAKLQNSLSLHYPKDLMNVVCVTDGSDDATPNLVNAIPEVRLMHLAERKGKIAAVKRAIQTIDTPICIFSDANTFLNPEAIKRIVKHFEDPKVGAVAGEKRIYIPPESTASSAGEGIYWRYESLLKKWDAELHSVVGAAGELFAIRTTLFPNIPTDTIIEDFHLTVTIAMKGYKVAYEPTAYAMETGSATVEEEFKRKVRICAGGFQAIKRLYALFNPFQYGWLSFQFISHRVLRWTLAPLSLLLVFLTNLILVLQGQSFYFLLFICQIGFYGLAYVGYRRRNYPATAKYFFVPFYFSMMNIAAFLGFRRFLRNKQSVIWERAQRAKAVSP